MLIAMNVGIMHKIIVGNVSKGIFFSSGESLCEGSYLQLLKIGAELANNMCGPIVERGPVVVDMQVNQRGPELLQQATEHRRRQRRRTQCPPRRLKCADTYGISFFNFKIIIHMKHLFSL